MCASLVADNYAIYRSKATAISLVRHVLTKKAGFFRPPVLVRLKAEKVDDKKLTYAIHYSFDFQYTIN